MKNKIAIILAVMLVLSLFTVGCKKKEENQPENPVNPEATATQTAEPTVYETTVGFEALIKDSANSVISGGKLKVTVGNDVFEGTADTNGILSIEGLPAMNRMKSVITDAAGNVKCEFLISIWEGYDLSCYSNKDLVSIDMQEGTNRLYAVLGITDEGYAKCETISVTGLEAYVQPTPTDEPIIDEGGNEGNEGQNNGTDSSTKKYVNSDGINVRSTASTSGDVVANLGLGTKVTVTDDGTKDGEHTWYAVSFEADGDTKTGFIRDDLLSDKKIIASDGVNMRESGSTSAKKVATLGKGTNVYLLGDTKEDGDHTWYKVRCKADGKVVTGYVRDDLLKDE